MIKGASGARRKKPISWKSWHFSRVL